MSSFFCGQKYIKCNLYFQPEHTYIIIQSTIISKRGSVHRTVKIKIWELLVFCKCELFQESMPFQLSGKSIWNNMFREYLMNYAIYNPIQIFRTFLYSMGEALVIQTIFYANCEIHSYPWTFNSPVHIVYREFFASVVGPTTFLIDPGGSMVLT